MTALNDRTLRRWRRNPISFIEEVLRDPETRKPVQLFEAERQFLRHAFKTGPDGRLLYPEQIFAAIKKSGKTGFAAIFLLTLLLLYGGRNAEGYCVANDLEQATSRVFEQCRRIIEASPLLRRETKITNRAISFPDTGASITALASDYASAAGAHPTITVLDELWAYTSERSRRLFDELVQVPTRKISCRLTVTHAGFSGESELLEELYKRGLSQPQIGPSLYAGDGLLMAWHHERIAPWQDERWLADMRRSLRPNQYLRMIENRFVTSETSFIDAQAFDKCVDPAHRPTLVDRTSPVWIGVDASIKHDSTAVVAVRYDRDRQRVVLVNHKIFQPSPEHPIDFEGAIEQTVLDFASTYKVKAVLYDPYQMVSSAQRLTKLGLPMVEFPETIDRLTASSQNLYELFTGRNLVLYPDEQIRTAALRAIAIESSRGWRIGKEKQTHKIDVIVALAMASLVAVREQRKRDLRQFGETGVEVDPRTGRPLTPGRAFIYRAPDGSLRLRSDNTGRSTLN